MSAQSLVRSNIILNTARCFCPEDRDLIAFEGNCAAIGGSLGVNREVVEEQIDGAVSHKSRIWPSRTMRARASGRHIDPGRQSRQRSLGLFRGHEDVDVQVTGPAWVERPVGERDCTPESVGDGVFIEAAVYSQQPLGESHRFHGPAQFTQLRISPFSPVTRRERIREQQHIHQLIPERASWAADGRISGCAPCSTASRAPVRQVAEALRSASAINDRTPKPLAPEPT